MYVMVVTWWCCISYVSWARAYVCVCVIVFGVCVCVCVCVFNVFFNYYCILILRATAMVMKLMVFTSYNTIS
jgi:hypothetical protein